MADRFKLRLSKLSWISLVDEPAQQSAKVLLVKRAGTSDEVQVNATAKIVKISEGADPLIYCWAFTVTDEHGQPYTDLQGDQIQDDFIKAAEEYVAAGARGDEMHTREQTGRIAFAFPMDPDIAKAFFGAPGSEIKTVGLMIAVRAAPEALAKVRSGEYSGVSIDGVGVREPIDKAAPKCKGCGAYLTAAATKCAGCGMEKQATATRKAAWTTAEIDDLPDSSFLYIEGGGKKDAAGKTAPRSLRHFPYRDAAGKVDIDHLRDAVGRIPQSSLPKTLRDKLQVKAEKLLAAQHTSKRVRKEIAAAGSTTVLTNEVDGHQHSLDLDDPADTWRDQLSTSYQTAEGADNGHSHAWTYDAATGAITVAADSGHTHQVSDVVPRDVIAQAVLNETGERCRGCGDMCEQGCRFCPSCGVRLGGDAVPTPVTDEKSSGAVVTVAVAARSPAAISTPAPAVPTVKGTSQESPPMPMDATFAKLLSTALLLPDAQRAHVAKLAPADQEAFLGLDAAGRDGALKVADAADPVVHTTKSGTLIRKSHGELALMQAKQLDAQAEQLEKQATESAALKAANERVTLEKRATDLIPLIAKSLAERVAIIKAVDAIGDEAIRNGAVEALKGSNEAFRLLGVPQGVNPHEDAGSNSAQKRLELKVTEYAKANNLPYPVALVKAAASDPEIRQLYNEAQVEGN